MAMVETRPPRFLPCVCEKEDAPRSIRTCDPFAQPRGYCSEECYSDHHRRVMMPNGMTEWQHAGGRAGALCLDREQYVAFSVCVSARLDGDVVRAVGRLLLTYIAKRYVSAVGAFNRGTFGIPISGRYLLTMNFHERTVLSIGSDERCTDGIETVFQPVLMHSDYITRAYEYACLADKNFLTVTSSARKRELQRYLCDI